MLNVPISRVYPQTKVFEDCYVLVHGSRILLPVSMNMQPPHSSQRRMTKENKYEFVSGRRSGLCRRRLVFHLVQKPLSLKCIPSPDRPHSRISGFESLNSQFSVPCQNSSSRKTVPPRRAVEQQVSSLTRHQDLTQDTTHCTYRGSSSLPLPPSLHSFLHPPSPAPHALGSGVVRPGVDL